MKRRRHRSTIVFVLLVVSCRHVSPPHEVRFDLRISAPKRTYIVGEPIEITQDLVNVSGRTLTDVPYPLLQDAGTDLYYRRGWRRTHRFGTFFEAHRLRQGVVASPNHKQRIAIDSGPLRPHARMSRTYWLVYNASESGLMFAAAGTYSLQLAVECSTSRTVSNDSCSLRSNVLRIVVRKPDPTDATALAAWTDSRILALVQGEERGYGFEETELSAERAAAALVDAYPTTSYATFARGALARYFEYRDRNSRPLTGEERAIRVKYAGPD